MKSKNTELRTEVRGLTTPPSVGAHTSVLSPQSSDLSPPSSERGSTLVISLIILILLMLLGVTAMKTSDTQFQLAGNLQFEDSAMNNAEAALNAGETWITGSTPGGVKNILDPGFTSYNLGIPATPQLYPAGTAPDPLTMAWNDTTSDPVANTSQRYTIELSSTNSRLIGSSQTTGGRSSAGCNQVNTYRINARGTSARGATKFVQSYYSVLSC